MPRVQIYLYCVYFVEILIEGRSVLECLTYISEKVGHSFNIRTSPISNSFDLKLAWSGPNCEVNCFCQKFHQSPFSL